MYRVDLPSSLESGKEVTVEVETVYSHTLKPYPSHITQAEKQFVKFVANIYFYSPYKSRSQTTVVTCASSSIDFFTREKPSTQSDKVITYGPYEDVDAFKEVGQKSFKISTLVSLCFPLVGEIAMCLRMKISMGL